MDDNGVAVLAWCPNCALPVRVDQTAAHDTVCPACEVAPPTARDLGGSGIGTDAGATRSVEDLV
jgi:hypothetical protein